MKKILTFTLILSPGGLFAGLTTSSGRDGKYLSISELVSSKARASPVLTSNLFIYYLITNRLSSPEALQAPFLSLGLLQTLATQALASSMRPGDLGDSGQQGPSSFHVLPFIFYLFYPKTYVEPIS